MMQEIEIDVDYRPYYFDCIEAAIGFAQRAAQYAEDEVRVIITIKITKEESAENGED